MRIFNDMTNSILVIANSFHPNIGGIARFQVGLSDYLASQFSDVHVCTLRSQHSPGLHDAGYAIHNVLWPKARLFNSNALAYLLNAAILVALVLRLRPRVIISANYLPAAILSCLPTILNGNRHIVYTHGSELLAAAKTPVGRLWLRIVARCTDLIVYNSTLTMHKAASLGLFESVPHSTVIPPLFMNAHYRTLMALQSRPPARHAGFRFITIGSHDGKGIDLAMDAIEDLARSSPQLQLEYLVIGPIDARTYGASLRSTAQALPKNLEVRFVGPIDMYSAEFYGVFSGADCYVMLSTERKMWYESYGIAYFEALCAGLPIIASTLSGAGPDLAAAFPGHVTLVDPSDHRAISAAMHGVLHGGAAPGADTAAVTQFADSISRQWQAAVALAEPVLATQ